MDTVNTNIATAPYSIDLSPWIPWTSPTLSNGTSVIGWASLRYPSDLQTDLDTTITFRWSKASNADRYIIQISFDPGFTVLENNDSISADTAKTFNDFLKGKKYYWRVNVQSVAGVGLWSKVSSFITMRSPAKPQLLDATPIQDQPGYATYAWNRVHYADQYFIQISTTPTFTRAFRTGSTSDTVKTFSGHSDGQRYYWQVRANNIAGPGLWSDVASSTLVGTDAREVGDIPTEYSIHQNYPNPFNPTTTLEFALPQRSQTKLIVYDLLGRGVRTLIDAELDAGYHGIDFDASNFPSGIYFYTIQSGIFVQTKKMVSMN